MAETKVFQDYVGEAREEIQKSHPLAARSAPLLSALADAMGYQAWRAARSYDHMNIMFGARMRDGSAGYLLEFHDSPTGDTGRVTNVVLSSQELRDLVAKAVQALRGEKGESLWRYARSRRLRRHQRTHGGVHRSESLP